MAILFLSRSCWWNEYNRHWPKRLCFMCKLYSTWFWHFYKSSENPPPTHPFSDPWRPANLRLCTLDPNWGRWWQSSYFDTEIGQDGRLLSYHGALKSSPLAAPTSTCCRNRNAVETLSLPPGASTKRAESARLGVNREADVRRSRINKRWTRLSASKLQRHSDATTTMSRELVWIKISQSDVSLFPEVDVTDRRRRCSRAVKRRNPIGRLMSGGGAVAVWMSSVHQTASLLISLLIQTFVWYFFAQSKVNETACIRSCIVICCWKGDQSLQWFFILRHFHFDHAIIL